MMPRLTEVFIIREAPHLEIDTDSPYNDMHFGTVDFMIERMPIDMVQKRELMKAFSDKGFVGKTEKGWLYFSDGEGGKKKVSKATDEQVASLPKLPDGWEKLMRNIE